MPLPRLTEIGDTATLTVVSCVPQTTPKGEAVVFTFDGHDDTLLLPRLGVDGALIRLGFYDPPSRAEGGDGIVRYDDVKGEALIFERTKPARGTTPGWRIEKVAPVAAPVVAAAPPRAEVAPVKAPAPALPDKEAQRQAVRDRYAAEFAWALDTLVPLARKKKVVISFDVNASVGSLMIDFGKRGLI